MDSAPAKTEKTSQPRKHIWVITGPAGCGKTSVATYLVEQLSLPYIEGDDYHPASNIQKMSQNIPLTDADRWDWLVALRQQSLAQLQPGDSKDTHDPKGVILTCSALKREYRDVIRGATKADPAVRVHFLYLRADEATLLKRVKERKGHYMKDDMVKSQFNSLQEPMAEEVDCSIVDVGGEPDEVHNKAVAIVRKGLQELA